MHLGGVFLNRKAAVNLIKRITEEKCTNLTGHDILLMQPSVKNEDYDLHIKATMDEASFRCLEAIAEHNGYVVKKEVDKGLIVIFSPEKGMVHPDYEETGIM